MNKYRFIFLFLLFLSLACKDKDKQTGQSENNIDAARNFIRAALDGKFNEARTYLLTDSANTNWMDVAERSYEKAGQSIKDGYRGASINIHRVTTVNDSTTVIIFSNSFKNDHDTLKVLKMNGQWLIDLKYLYIHDEDTTTTKTMIKDSLP